MLNRFGFCGQPADSPLRRLPSKGLRVVETGLAYGTVTVMADGQSAEVTQLRSDRTDGRHAKIQPTSDWQTDAKRRDFTINALYLDADGVIHDLVGGL